MTIRIKKLAYSALFLALCLLLPFLTGQIPQIGGALSPMHIPVLLCGFVCGAPWAAAMGFVAPLLRFLLFGMPPIYPTGLGMAFELCAYGVFAALFYHYLPKKPVHVYTSLLGAMIFGRIVYGIARFVMASASGAEFTMQMFVAGAFVQAIPGIILHIVLIPIVVFALQKGGYMLHD